MAKIRKIATSPQWNDQFWRNLVVMRLGHPVTVSQRNFVISTIQDGGRRHLENGKILISSPLIDRFWRSLACWCVSPLCTPIANKISRFQISKIAAVAMLKKSKNCNISAIERPILTKFGEMMCLGHPATDSQWNFLNSIIQDGGRRHLEKSQNLNIFATGPVSK